MDDLYPSLTWKIIGSAIEVHRCLGPGLLESTYRTCLMRQLKLDGMSAATEVSIPIVYKGEATGAVYRADLVVEQTVLIEFKAVEQVLPVHHAQMLTYLRLTGIPLGLMINFNVPQLKQGVRRFANSHRNEPDRPAVTISRRSVA